jgi:hypothetical protein
VLSKLVRKYEIDLIVIGTCGRKELGQLLLGSVAVGSSAMLSVQWSLWGLMLPAGRSMAICATSCYATDFGQSRCTRCPTPHKWLKFCIDAIHLPAGIEEQPLMQRVPQHE